MKKPSLWSRHPRGGLNSSPFKHRLGSRGLSGSAPYQATLRKPDRKLKELSLLAKSHQLITSSLNLKEVLTFIVEACTDFMKVVACHIRLLNEENELVFVAASGAYKDSQEEFRKLKVGESLSGWVVAHGEPLAVVDVVSDTRNVHRQLSQKYGFKSFLGVPLKIRGKVIGVLGMNTAQTRHFSEEEIQWISSFASQASIAIENARLYEESREQAKQLALIYDITNKIRSSLDLETIIFQTLASLKDIVHYDHAGITLPDESGENILARSLMREGSRISPPPKIVLPLRGSALEWMLTSRQAHIQNDLMESRAFPVDEVLLSWGVRAIIRIPLIVKDKVIGLLFLNSQHPGYYGEKTLGVLHQIAGQLAIAIENARLFEESEKRRQEAEEATRLKSRFLANISHELKTPLTCILGYSELLKSQVHGPLNATQLQQVQIMHKNGQNLLRFIDDLLSLATLEAGKLNLRYTEFSIKDAIQTTIESARLLLKNKPIHLNLFIQPEVPVRIYSDEERIHQVLINLLANAVKFTKQGEIRLSVGKFTGRRAQDPAEYLEISISDTGIGIPPEELENIFEEFRQVDGSGTRKYGGVGLGLTICKRILKLLGGDIWVKSELGKGSTFKVLLPLNKPTQDLGRR